MGAKFSRVSENLAGLLTYPVSVGLVVVYDSRSVAEHVLVLLRAKIAVQTPSLTFHYDLQNGVKTPRWLDT